MLTFDYHELQGSKTMQTPNKSPACICNAYLNAHSPWHKFVQIGGGEAEGEGVGRAIFRFWWFCGMVRFAVFKNEKAQFL